MANSIESAAAMLGRRGGQAKTPKKMRSCRKNVKKAHAARRRQIESQKNGQK